MSLHIEITPSITDLHVEPTVTLVEVNLAVPYAGANAIEKTPEVQKVAVVSILPEPTDPQTLYFII